MNDLPEGFLPMRVLPVGELRPGDIVQPGMEPQTVQFVSVLQNGQVRLKLTDGALEDVDPGFVYKLIRRVGEPTG